MKSNKTLSGVFGFLAYIWLAGFVILFILGIFGIFISEGFSGVASTLSPFNFVNYLVVLLGLSPFIIFQKLRDYFAGVKSLPQGMRGDLAIRALGVFNEEKRVSPSLLVKKLKLSYAEAAGLMSYMEEQKYISGGNGKPWKLLVKFPQ